MSEDKSYKQIDEWALKYGPDILEDILRAGRFRVDFYNEENGLKGAGRTQEAKDLRDKAQEKWDHMRYDLEKKLLKQGVSNQDPEPWEYFETVARLPENQLDAYEDHIDQDLANTITGLTLNLYPDLVAGFKSSFGDEEYGKVRDALWRKLDVHRMRNPVKSFAQEWGGVLVPTGAVAKLAQLGFKGAGAVRKLLNSILGGAAAGGVSGFGAQRGNEFGRRLVSGGVGGAVGGITGGGLHVAGKVVSPIGKAIWSRLSKQGDTISNSAKKEIQRIARTTGKSPEQLIEDAVNGKPISANESTHMAIKSLAMREAGPATKKMMADVDEDVISRGRDISKRIKENLAPEYHDGNIRKNFEAALEKRNKQVSDQYDKYLDPDAALDKIDTKDVDFILERYPEVLEDLKKYYRKAGLDPLILSDNGSSRFARELTPRDLEEIRKALRDNAKALNKKGKGALAGLDKQAEGKIKSIIDKVSPEMPVARRNFEAMKEYEKAFDEGSKLKIGDVADVDYQLDLLRSKADKLKNKAKIVDSEEFEKHLNPEQAFRAGAARKYASLLGNKQTLTGLADEAMPKREVLQMLLKGSEKEAIPEAIDTAVGMRKLRGVLQEASGSQTYPLSLQELMSDVGNIVVGDMPTEAGGAIGAMIRKFRSEYAKQIGVSEKNADNIFRALISQDPAFLRKVLNADTSDKMKKVINDAMVAVNAIKNASSAQSGAWAIDWAGQP